MFRISNTLPHQTIKTALCTLSEITRRSCLGISRRCDRGALGTPRTLSQRPVRSTIPLGVPRTTRSVCPGCVIDKRNAVLQGRADIDALKRDPGVIDAEIVEEAGRVLMRKVCQ